jgi:hypothetical protein
LRVKIGFLVVIASVVLWVGAVCSPAWSHKDRNPGLTRHEAAVLKTEASHWSKIPAAWMQITEGVSGPSSCDGYCPDGTVVWYGPFGVARGQSELRSGDVVRDSVDVDGLFGDWILLFVLELALVGIAVFCLAPLVRRRWPKIERIVWKWDRHF